MSCCCSTSGAQQQQQQQQQQCKEQKVLVKVREQSLTEKNGQAHESNSTCITLHILWQPLRHASLADVTHKCLKQLACKLALELLLPLNPTQTRKSN
jgi:hypothetical protein